MASGSEGEYLTHFGKQLKIAACPHFSSSLSLRQDKRLVRRYGGLDKTVDILGVGFQVLYLFSSLLESSLKEMIRPNAIQNKQCC